MAAGDVVGLTRRHWLFVVVVSLLGVTLGVVWAATRTPEYSAKAEVLITVTSGESTGDLAQGSDFSRQQARNFAALATREIVLAPVIEELGVDLSVADLRQRVSATVPLNTSLISLQVTDSNPALAAGIANAAATELANTVADLSPEVDDLRGAPVGAQLIETAAAPVTPSSPNFNLFALFGLLGGFVLAVAFRLVSELVASRITSIDQLEPRIAFPVLGSINRDAAGTAHPIAVVADPLSVRAEQVRHVRTALKYRSGSEHRVFVVSSAVSGEGKSTTAAHVAAAFAADGVSTCLIEADLRRPTVAELLDLSNGIGLSDVIAGEFSMEEALQSWGPDGLKVITAGGVPPNPSELLGSDYGLGVLRQLQARFEVTIIDTPPITAVTDAIVLGRHFGGIVLVLGFQRARIIDLRRAMSALAAAEVALRGAVLNLVKPERATDVYAYGARGQTTKGRRGGVASKAPAWFGRPVTHSDRQGAGRAHAASAGGARMVGPHAISSTSGYESYRPSTPLPAVRGAGEGLD